MTKGKKKKRVKFKVKNIIILLLVFFILFGCCYYFVMMPIKNIYISGNEKLNDEEIRELANIDMYPSFILTNRFEIVKKLVSHSYIKDAVVKKRFGNVLEIDIVEYRSIASNRDGMIILSSGEVVDNNYGIYDVPMLINDISDNRVYNSFALGMEELDYSILRQISEIEYSPVEVDDERFLFYMSDGNLVHVTLTKLDKLNKYNKIKDKLSGKRGIIYLDSGYYVELID